jgi:hypothetical protein
MTGPKLTLTEAQDIVATKTAPRISKESIEGRIQQVEYLTHGQTTICLIVMINQFKVIGHSTPASAANFDPEVGKTYAYENAFKQLWPLEGYLLREKLHQEVNPDPK